MNKKHISIIILILLAFSIYFIFIKKNVDSYEEIININNKNDSIEDIKKKGYIDLREVQDGENKEVTRFFNSFKSNKKDELKVITKDKDDKIFLTFYDIDTSYKVIRAHSRPYDSQSLELIGYSEIKTEKNNNIKEVYLKETYYPTPTAGEEKANFNWVILYKYK